jgi:hypothetical protein
MSALGQKRKCALQNLMTKRSPNFCSATISTNLNPLRLLDAAAANDPTLAWLCRNWDPI